MVPSSPPSTPASTHVRLASRGDGLHEVTFRGPLRLGWLASLAGALSRRGISIIRAHAERGLDGQWTAQLELDSGSGSVDIAGLDLLSLTEEVASAPRDPAQPRLSSFRLTRLPDELLELVVTGPDEVGFLSALFARLGFLGLFPDRISATTRSGRIDDTLTLRGIAGEAPSTGTEQALRTALTRITSQSGRAKTPSGAPPDSKS